MIQLLTKVTDVAGEIDHKLNDAYNIDYSYSPLKYSLPIIRIY